MNKSYRLIYNEITQTWVAVSEITKGRGKRASGAVLLAGAVALSPAMAEPPAATQLPTGGQVVAGQASISQSAATLNVNQTSNRAALDWQTFNVGKSATVNFNQPGSSSVTLNRVQDANPSQIFGRINANGQVFLSNPNGVYFAPGASVDVGGLVATTHKIGLSDFMAGNAKFERAGSTASVLNEGELKAALGGYIALLAPEVRNQGIIIAQAGTVALASGEAVTLHIEGGNTLAGITVAPSLIAALVENKSMVLAPGGLIILSAQAANKLQGGVIKNSGTLDASSLVSRGGRIVLDASDRIEHTGSITAAGSATQAGGSVEISAPQVELSGSIDVSGSTGGSVLVKEAESLVAHGEILARGLAADSQAVQLISTQTLAVQATAQVEASDTSGSGKGGTVELAAGGSISLADARVDTSGDTQGGKITVRADKTLRPVSQHHADPLTPNSPPTAPPEDRPLVALTGNTSLRSNSRRGQGGAITLTGDDLTLGGTSTLEATGATGGGTVLVGGGWQGSGGLHQSTTVTMEAGAKIDVSATQHGAGGTAVLWSDVHKADSQTTVAGHITANGAGGGTGGQVETSGHKLSITDSASVKTGGGEWLLDPYDFTVAASGGDITGAALGTALGSGNVSITVDINTSSVTTTSLGGAGNTNTTYSGGIFINDPVSWSANTLTLTASKHIYVNSVVSVSGNGALTLTPNTTGFSNGSTGYLKTQQSGGSFSGRIDWTSSGALTIGGSAYTKITDQAGLAGMTGANKYFLANDLALTGSWTPLTSFSGMFEGLGHTLGNLTNGTSTSDDQGLFGTISGATIQNIGITSGTITGGNNIGALVGRVTGGTNFVGNVFTAPAVSGTPSVTVESDSGATTKSYIGGLVGKLDGAILNVLDSSNGAYVNAKAGAANTIDSVGGILGGNAGTNSIGIYGSSNSGQIVAGTVANKSSANLLGTHVGGVMGRLKGTTINAFTINQTSDYPNGIFTQNFTTNSGNIYGESVVGGILGGITAGTFLPNTYLQYLKNTGNITSYSGSIGGIVGGINGWNWLEISYAANKGNITVTYPSAGSAMSVGGIAGFVYMNGSQRGSILYSYNEGTISASTANRVGGIVGEMSDSGTGTYIYITDSYNVGSVTGNGDVGSLAGYLYSDGSDGIVFQNNYSAGTVTAAARGSAFGTISASNNNVNLTVLNSPYLNTLPSNIYTISVNTLNQTGSWGAISDADLKSSNVLMSSPALGDYTKLNSGKFALSASINNGYPYLSSMVPTTAVTINVNVLSKTYGDANPSLSSQYSLSGCTGCITLDWGSAATTTLAAGSYAYNTSNLLALTYVSGGAGSYSLTWGSNNFTVNPYALTVTAPAVTKTYDGSTSATGTSTYSAFVAGQSVNTAPTLAFDTKHVGSGNKTVTPSGLTIKDGSNNNVTGNYNITYTANTTSTINPLALSATAPSITKTYDGGLTASGNVVYASTRGSGTDTTALGSGDTIGTAPTLVFTDKNAGSNKTVNASGLVINDGNGGNNYTVTYYSNNTGAISKKTVGLSVASKVYDGTTNEAGNVTVTTGVGSETLTYTGAQASSANVATAGKYLSAITLADGGSGGLASNYQLPTLNVANAPVTITVKPLAFTGSMTYAASTSVASSNLSPSNLIGSDVVTLTSGSATASSADAGTQTLSSMGTLALGGAAASNYTLTGATGSVVINPFTLSFTSPTITAKTYDGTTSASVSAWNSNIFGADSGNVSFSGSATFADKNKGTSKPVNITGITKSGSKAGNYQFASGAATGTASSTGTITAKTVTLAGTSSLSKTYDGTTNMTNGITGYGSAVGLISGDSVAVAGSPVWSNAGAGSGKTINQGTVALSGADAGNYNLSWSNGSSGTINKATLTMMAQDAYKLLTDSDPTFTYTFSGFVNGEDATALTSKSVSRTGTQTAAATYHGVLVPTFTADNYVLNAINGNFTIVPAETLLVTLGNSTKVYGSANPTLSLASSAKYLTAGNVIKNVSLTHTGSGNYTYDDSLGTTGGFTVATSALTNSNVNNYSVTLTNFTKTGTNFTSQLTQPGSLAVTQLGATLGAGTASKVYDGNTNASGSVAVSNKVGSDDVMVNGTGSYTTKTVGTGKDYTLSNLNLTGTSAANYFVSATTFNGSNGVVTARPITWSVDNASSTYGTTAIPGLGRLSNTVAGDAIAPTVTVYQTGTSTVVTPAANTPVGNYDEKVSAITGADIGNYTLGSGTTGILSIGQKPIVLTAPAISKTYDGASTYTTQPGDLISVATAAGIVAGDTLSALTLAFADKNAGTNKTVTPSAATLSGSSNYSIAYASANSGTINPLSISVSAAPTAANKVYDGLTSASLSGGGALTGVLGADTGSVSLTQVGIFTDANAANGKTVNLAYNLTGTEAGNYTLSSASGTTTANITKAALTVTANDAAKIVFDSDPTFTARYSGFVNGETESVLTSPQVIRSGGDSAAGSYPGVLAPSATSSNYTISTTNGNFTIVPADTLLISVANQSKVYGDALPALTATQAKYCMVGCTDNSGIRTLTLVNTSGNSYTYDDGNGTTGGFDVSTAASAGTNIGAAAITVSNFTKTGTNFNSQTTSNGNLTITQRPVSVGVTGASKTYDGTTSMSGATVDVANKYSSDEVAITGTGSYADKNAGTGKSYTFNDLALSGAKAANYYLTAGNQTNTDGTINQRTLAVTYTGIHKTYDASTSASVTTADDRVSGDDLNIVRTANFQNKNAGNAKPIDITGVSLTGADWANYSVAATASASADIAQRALNVVYTGNNKPYDGTTAATVATDDDRVAGDVLTISRTATFADKMAASQKAITISSVSLSGTDGANYSVAASGATAADITLLPLSVTAPTASKAYDGTLSAPGSATLGALAATDSVNVAATLNYLDKHVATGKTVQASGLTIKDGSNADMTANYAIQYVDDTASAITTKSLNVTAPIVVKTYDGTTAASGNATVGTLATGDTVSKEAFLVFTSKNAGTSNRTVQASGAYLQDAFGQDMTANYAITYVDNTASTIAKAPLDVTAPFASKTYDGTTSASGSATVGTLIGEDVVNAAASVTFTDKNIGTASKSVRASGLT
ncbi:MAG: filamentous hemagglutinin N-terminal domain-containing protein [Rhodoferax sp.]|nr:filamentous hemagglutinin N-terminal domain-containing protein [Rhodoferax sp.]